MIMALLRRYGALVATGFVFAMLYVTAAVVYDGFSSPRVLVGFFADNAFLGIAAIGMTLVILSGGIDLSVGAVIGCASIMLATLIELGGWHPLVAAVMVLAFGTVLGASMGALIHLFELPPFIVTLAGMFFARGLGFVVHQESVAIRHGLLADVHDLPTIIARMLRLPETIAEHAPTYAPVTAVVFLVVACTAAAMARWTKFGRNVYAVGGSEESARLMGLPVGRTKVQVYAWSGLCSALAGIVYALYTFSGNPTAGTMLELDAIAAAVIGGTLLSGGVGTIFGTVLGVLIFGVIQTAIVFDGRLSSWWTRITIGGLVLTFLVFQRLLHHLLACRMQSASSSDAVEHANA
ncbi:MAG: galactofuranose ABC transporter, permease protein YjfF [Planctomycetota bacterium]|jgi:simple sugar transport system permease protein